MSTINYEFKTTPFAHQWQVLENSWTARFFALFMEMGTGKTKIALDTMSLLYDSKEIDACFIVAPKGVYDNWIKQEIPTHVSIKHKILRWAPNHSKKYKTEANEFFKYNGPELKIFVMNVEAFSQGKANEIAQLFLRRHPKNLTIIDESTTIKNRKAQRSKNIIALNKLSKYRRILTGSPITKSPMDLFSQCAFLSKDALGFSSYYAFRGRYSIVAHRMLGPKTFTEITGYKKLDELTDKLEKFSSRILKSECLDLPEKIYLRRDVILSQEQARAYTQMHKLALAKLDNGELATTASVLTQIMRLQQICCGFLQPDEGDLKVFPNKRLDSLMEIIEETQGEAIIWATYTFDIKNIAKVLRAKFGASAVATYYGETPQDERQEIVTKFQDPNSDLLFFVGQPKTGGYGITLTAASTVIYYSNSYDLEIRLQSEDRAHRIGQKKAVTYIDLVSPGTIDEKILSALRSKINLASIVLNEDPRKWL